MAMNKTLLFDKVKNELIRNKNKVAFVLKIALYLIEKTIFNDPKVNCIIKSKKEDCSGLTDSCFESPNDTIHVTVLCNIAEGILYLDGFAEIRARQKNRMTMISKTIR